MRKEGAKKEKEIDGKREGGIGEKEKEEGMEKRGGDIR